MQTFSKTAIVLGYFANTKNYAARCVNLAKPRLHCNGRCQMMKQLKQEEKKDAQIPERKLENKNELLLFFQYSTAVADVSVSQRLTIYPVVLTGKTTNMPRSLLRPPIC